MTSKNKELVIYINDTEYENHEVEWIYLDHCRNENYKTIKAAIVDAYSSYDPSFTPLLLDAIKGKKIRQYIYNRYNISYDEDLLYLLRHPEYYSSVAGERCNRVIRKNLCFRFVEGDGSTEERLYSDLSNMSNIERVDIITKAINQHLILTDNEFYLNHLAARLLYDLHCKATFGKDGKPDEATTELINSALYSHS